MSFIHFFDLLGTFAFAVSGALLGVKKRMDIYGLFVLALAVAMGGRYDPGYYVGEHSPSCVKRSPLPLDGCFCRAVGCIF